MKNVALSSKTFDEFLKKNRMLINKNMGAVLSICILSGPAIALGIFTGVFSKATYDTCFVISICMTVLAVIHYFLYKLMPSSIYTSLFALFAMDTLILYMDCSAISIYITWFLVPFVSILFCDARIYNVANLANYAMMSLGVMLSTQTEVTYRADYTSAHGLFMNIMSGLTIELIIMYLIGYKIVVTIKRYYKNLIDNQLKMDSDEMQLSAQLNLLDSMAEVYEKVNLVDFEKGTEQPIRDPKKEIRKINLDKDNHTYMTTKLSERIAADQVEEFLKFTDISTVQSRLINKKVIWGEFIDMFTGWFRAEYITVDVDSAGIPTKVVFTTQSIDEEKRREEHLHRIAMTDELTRLYNRRSYDEDISIIKKDMLTSELGIVSVDVNGLKVANDTKGHAAGDELIKGAADCLLLSIGNLGKVYRTGGDEFMAIIYTDDFDFIVNKIKYNAINWAGNYSNELSLSIGYATYRDYEGSTIEELERIADALMYKDKEEYYKSKGIYRHSSFKG
ncbi:MAG: GGDEF domain-containing protein [Pseudobutyrivibrio sp.]|nr:GGDEF domain-containing protein [Pseudobutyrivibrio sp.]